MEESYLFLRTKPPDVETLPCCLTWQFLRALSLRKTELPRQSNVAMFRSYVFRNSAGSGRPFLFKRLEIAGKRYLYKRHKRVMTLILALRSKTLATPKNLPGYIAILARLACGGTRELREAVVMATNAAYDCYHEEKETRTCTTSPIIDSTVARSCSSFIRLPPKGSRQWKKLNGRAGRNHSPFPSNYNRAIRRRKR